MSEPTILIGHGAGGKLSRDLIQDVFVNAFSNPSLNPLNDASIVPVNGKIAFTTDSYVVDPIIFPGGNIGKLAVSGTVNDLLVCGVKPLYLSAGFIIEEGFSIPTLKEIAASMAEEARLAGVSIITGDTKVVKKGQCDKVFINTAGIGEVIDGLALNNPKVKLEENDCVVVSGYLGDHAMAILAARNDISFEQELISDVAPLNKLILPLYESFPNEIKFARDITRGGIATVLNELTENSPFGIELFEESIPIREAVHGICEIFGYDPLYLANEGKVAFVVSETKSQALVKAMRQLPYGSEAQIIGRVKMEHPGKVTMRSLIGGSRIVDMLSGEMLPRIC